LPVLLSIRHPQPVCLVTVHGPRHRCSSRRHPQSPTPCLCHRYPSPHRSRSHRPLSTLRTCPRVPVGPVDSLPEFLLQALDALADGVSLLDLAFDGSPFVVTGLPEVRIGGSELSGEKLRETGSVPGDAFDGLDCLLFELPV
jgi:hypothetical protein